eukprot:6480505-Amphidinium_carterae.1
MDYGGNPIHYMVFMDEGYNLRIRNAAARLHPLTLERRLLEYKSDSDTPSDVPCNELDKTMSSVVASFAKHSSTWTKLRSVQNLQTTS